MVLLAFGAVAASELPSFAQFLSHGATKSTLPADFVMPPKPLGYGQVAPVDIMVSFDVTFPNSLIAAPFPEHEIFVPEFTTEQILALKKAKYSFPALQLIDGRRGYRITKTSQLTSLAAILCPSGPCPWNVYVKCVNSRTTLESLRNERNAPNNPLFARQDKQLRDLAKDFKDKCFRPVEDSFFNDKSHFYYFKY